MMKRFLFIFGLAVAQVFGASEIGLLPEERVAVVVSSTERNPFGINQPKVEEVKPKEENEEARIRVILEDMEVAGIMRGPSGTKVLLGPLMLEEGGDVPPVLPNQREQLKVVSISEKSMVLGFVNPDGSTSRKVFVSLNLTPSVQFKLPKRAKPAVGEAFDGVITKDEAAKQQ